MNKIFIILATFVVIGCNHEKNPAQTISQPYNILWIVADDLGTDLGCYGNSIIKTPNLDKLAEESILYTNHHTVTAVCSPSRSTLITGMYPVSIDVHQHRTQFKKILPEGIQPITEYFREAGYFVTNGKAGNKENFGKTDYNFEHKVSELYDGKYWDERNEGQPFFAQLQIFYPHRPFYPDTLNPINEESIKLPPYYPDTRLLRKDWALYLETIQQVDKEVGEIMASLKEEGILENTIVFFFGDQGRPHVRAKQFLYNAGTNTPLMIRWPNGYGAGTTTDQLVSNIDLPYTTLKLANIPVPKHLQGKDIFDLNSEREYVYTMRDRRDETVDRIRAVTTKQYKYIKNFYPEKPYLQSNVYKDLQYPARPVIQLMNVQGKLNETQALFASNIRPAEELYDFINDPHEINNLALDPTYHKILEDLRHNLENWVDRYDNGKYPEDPEEIAYAEELMKKRRSEVLAQRDLPETYGLSEIIDFWEKKYGLKK